MNGKTVELKVLCQEIFQEMQRFAEVHKGETSGFNFSYSPEESWKPTTKILLLTLNPHAEPNEPPYFLNTPWPTKNAFLDEKNIFPIRDDILTILAEIAYCKTGQKIAASCKDKDLKNFVDNHVVLASYVPFRTGGKGDITKEMWEFAKKEYWSRLLQIWQPELIITTGNDSFFGIRRILKKISGQTPKVEEKKVSDFQQKDTLPLCHGHYRICNTRYPSGKTTCLLGVPHPAAAFGLFGFPVRDGRFGPENAPIQRFLREELKNFKF